MRRTMLVPIIGLAAVGCGTSPVQLPLVARIETPANVLLFPGESRDLLGRLFDATGNVISDGESAVTWSTSDDWIAAVSPRGTVTAASTGQATITARAGSAVAQTEVQVLIPSVDMVLAEVDGKPLPVAFDHGTCANGMPDTLRITSGTLWIHSGSRRIPTREYVLRVNVTSTCYAWEYLMVNDVGFDYTLHGRTGITFGSIEGTHEAGYIIVHMSIMGYNVLKYQ